MSSSQLIIDLPCDIDDEFWILAKDRATDKIIPKEVYCVSYNIINNSEEYLEEQRYIIFKTLDYECDYYKIPFSEFNNLVFNTKEEAEKYGTDNTREN